MKFKIQGPYSNTFDENLFWSNDAGWVGFDGATTFTEPQLRYPIETFGLAILNEVGKIMEVVHI